MHQVTELMLSIDPGPQADVEDQEQLTYQLQKEVAELDVEAVDIVRGEKIAQRAKVTLLVGVVASGGVLISLISAVESWLTSHERCSVTLKLGEDELEVKGMPSLERRQLIDVWLSRHGGT